MWAKGNVYLIVNTVYLVFQTFHSFLVAMEYPLWMRTFRITRLVSLVFIQLFRRLLFMSGTMKSTGLVIRPIMML